MRLRLLAPTHKAAALAKRLAAGLAPLYEIEIWQRPGRLSTEIKTCVEAGIPCVAICALGIIARSLAQATLPAKADTAPLLCATEEGGFFVPVLGGHRGANDLAQRLAGVSDGQAVITTVGDQRFGLSLDQPPAGWALRDGALAYSRFMQALLETGAADLSAAPLWLRAASLPHDPQSPLKISALYGPPLKETVESSPTHLIYQSQNYLALGLGCERHCPDRFIEALIAEGEERLGFSFPRPLAAASIDLKVDEAAFLRLAPAMQFFPASYLDTFTVPTPSKAVFAEVGTHSVAEASALALAGAGAQLLLPKIKNSKATLAVAASIKPLQPTELNT